MTNGAACRKPIGIPAGEILMFQQDNSAVPFCLTSEPPRKAEVFEAALAIAHLDQGFGIRFDPHQRKPSWKDLC